MKKIIAISVMFVLLTGAVFAADIGVTVIGTVDVVKSDTGDDAKMTTEGGLDRLRLSGSGENDDGSFGGWFRLDALGSTAADDWSAAGYAFWKPVDQVKMIIGSFPDGLWGKEGVTGWGFAQMVSDTGVSLQGGHVYGSGVLGLNTRQAFFGGQGDGGLMFEISPAEIASINIFLPAFDGGKSYKNDAGVYAKDIGESETGNVFASATAQLSLNLDFGNIAITYMGKPKYYNYWAPEATGSVIYAYFGGNFGSLSLDVGLGYQMAAEDKVAQPITFGVGVKYAADSFGVKFRAIASLAGDNKTTTFFADLLPYFILSDSMRAFVSVGVGMLMPDGGDTVSAFHFNPWIEVGQEWGPAFYVGLKVEKSSVGDPYGLGYDYASKDVDTITWSVPVALIVSF